MGEPIANLIVKIGAETKGLVDGAQKGVRSMKDMEDHAKRTAKAMAGIAVAATAAMAGLTVHAATAAKEIEFLSQVAGTTPKKFQDLAYGARTVGIETEKLADIYKDARDRVGDFITTGGGPMLDFFEQIAPKVGLTAKEFQHLSGPEVMQKFVKALEDANLAANEQVFYMEAMASDSSRLLPLLRDNAKTLNNLTAESDRLGMSLSDMQVEKMSELNDVINRLSGTVRGSFQRGYIEGFVDEFDEFSSMAQDPELAHALERIGSVIGVIARESVLFLADAVKKSERLIDLMNENPVTPSEQFDIMKQSIQSLLGGGADMGFDETRNIIKEMMAEGQELLELQTQMENQVIEMFAGFQKDKPANFGDFIGDFMGTESGTSLADLAGGGGFDGDAFDKAAQARLEKLQEAALTEQELLQTHYDSDLQLLQLALDAKQITEEQYAGLRISTYQQMQDALSDIESKGNQERIRDAQTFFSNIIGAANHGNKTLFAMQKAAAIGQALIAARESVVQAYEWGTSWGGPPAGAAMAAVAGAAQAANVAAIASTSMQSSGAVSSTTFSGGSGVPAKRVDDVSHGGGSSRGIDIRLTGVSASDMFSGAQIRELIGQINEEISDGARIRSVRVAT